MRGSEVLAWAGNNSAKLGLAGGPQCWTLFSTQQYGRANKVPQVRRAATSVSRPCCLPGPGSSPPANSFPTPGGLLASPSLPVHRLRLCQSPTQLRTHAPHGPAGERVARGVGAGDDRDAGGL